MIWLVKWHPDSESWRTYRPVTDERLPESARYFIESDTRSHAMQVAAEYAGVPLVWEWNKLFTEGRGTIPPTAADAAESNP